MTETRYGCNRLVSVSVVLSLDRQISVLGCSGHRSVWWESLDLWSYFRRHTGTGASFGFYWVYGEDFKQSFLYLLPISGEHTLLHTPRSNFKGSLGRTAPYVRLRLVTGHMRPSDMLTAAHLGWTYVVLLPVFTSFYRFLWVSRLASRERTVRSSFDGKGSDRRPSFQFRGYCCPWLSRLQDQPLCPAFVGRL